MNSVSLSFVPRVTFNTGLHCTFDQSDVDSSFVLGPYQPVLFGKNSFSLL